MFAKYSTESLHEKQTKLKIAYWKIVSVVCLLFTFLSYVILPKVNPVHTMPRKIENGDFTLNVFRLHQLRYFTLATESKAQGALRSSVNQKEESEAESEDRRNRSHKNQKSFYFFRFRFRFRRADSHQIRFRLRVIFRFHRFQRQCEPALIVKPLEYTFGG